MVNKINIPKDLQELMKIILDNGYECYLVGGAVRDSIIGIESKDYDLATNMPLEILKIKIPHVTIMKENAHRNTAIIRKNKYNYEFSLYKGKNIIEDLASRDFRINAMAVDLNGNLIDPFRGIENINQKIIDLVKENGEGLVVDPLRILRALRQAIKNNFSISESTKKQILLKKDLLNKVAPERIYQELKKILVADDIEFYLREYKDIFFSIIPEFKKCDGFKQYNDYHIYDVYEHIIKVVSSSPKNLYVRLAALFHDIGKPAKYVLDANGVGHFLGHAKVSVEIFKKFANKYKIDNKTKKVVNDMILYHEGELSIKNNKIYNFYKKYNMSKIEFLFALKIADIKGQNPKYINRINQLLKIKAKYIEIRNFYNEISYNGNDLIKLGFKDKEIGIILDDIKRKIINNQLENKKEMINNYVIKNYKE